MKRLKGKIISTLLSASIAVGTIGSISAMASGEKIYANIEPYSGSTYIVNIVVENLPNFASGGFHLELAKGWDLVMDGSEVYYNVEGCTAQGKLTFFMNLDNSSFTDNNDLFIGFMSGHNDNYNGNLLQLKVKKNKYYSASTSAINVRFCHGDHICQLTTNPDEKEILGEDYQPPVMLDSTQFVVGDADGDGIVDSFDASVLLNALEKQSAFNVQAIRHTYKNYFPAALCAAAPDADKSGIINNTDVSRIMNYYSTIATGGTYTGTVGKVEVFERFQ